MIFSNNKDCTIRVVRDEYGPIFDWIPLLSHHLGVLICIKIGSITQLSV